MIAALARQGIENGRDRVPPGESARVRVVVGAGHDQPHHDEHDGQTRCLTANQAAAAFAAVVHEGADQAEDRSRRAECVAGAAQEGNRNGNQTAGRAEQKSADARDRVDDDRPGWTEQLHGVGPQHPDPVHVEEQMQQVAVEP